MKPLFFFAAAAALSLFAAPALAEPQCSTHANSEAKATDPDQIILMIDAKDTIKQRLNDAHASFRNVYFCRTPRDQIAIACGEVRSSAMGGKGYVRFLSGGKAEMTSWEGDGKQGFDSAWDRFCKP
jgi:hypothetical protein